MKVIGKDGFDHCAAYGEAVSKWNQLPLSNTLGKLPDFDENNVLRALGVVLSVKVHAVTGYSDVAYPLRLVLQWLDAAEDELKAIIDLNPPVSDVTEA